MLRKYRTPDEKADKHQEQMTNREHGCVLLE